MFECPVYDLHVEFVDNKFLMLEKAAIETSEEHWVYVRAQGKIHVLPIHQIASMSYREAPK